MEKRNLDGNGLYVNGKYQKTFQLDSPADPAYAGVKSGSLADPSEPVNDPNNPFNSNGASDAAIREWVGLKSSTPINLTGQKRKLEDKGGTKRKKRRRNNKKTKRNRRKVKSNRK
jgi:hypothetical protein